MVMRVPGLLPSVLAHHSMLPVLRNMPLIGAIPVALMRATNTRASSSGTSADEVARGLAGEIEKK